jgi:hypothetical protein
MFLNCIGDNRIESSFTTNISPGSKGIRRRKMSNSSKQQLDLDLKKINACKVSLSLIQRMIEMQSLLQRASESMGRASGLHLPTSIRLGSHLHQVFFGYQEGREKERHFFLSSLPRAYQSLHMLYTSFAITKTHLGTRLLQFSAAYYTNLSANTLNFYAMYSLPGKYSEMLYLITTPSKAFGGYSRQC